MLLMKLNFNKVKYCLLWGSIIGGIRAIYTIASHYIEFLNSFSYLIDSLCYYGILTTGLIAIMYFYNDNKYINSLITGVLSSVAIAASGEIIQQTFFSITDGFYGISWHYFIENTLLLCILSTIVALFSKKKNNNSLIDTN